MISLDDKTEILQYAHYWNWAPDWDVVFEVYKNYPNSYSILTPFAYAYLEELIRSTTHEYGRVAYNEKGEKVARRKLGISLIKLAINENKNNTNYITLLEQSKKYFKESNEFDNGNNRNSTLHGYMHPRFWKKEVFEELIHFIAQISKYANF